MIAALVLTLVGMRDHLAACIAFVSSRHLGGVLISVQGPVFHLEIVTVPSVSALTCWCRQRASACGLTGCQRGARCCPPRRWRRPVRVRSPSARGSSSSRGRAVFGQCGCGGEPLDVRRKSDGGVARLDAEIFEPSGGACNSAEPCWWWSLAGCTAAAGRSFATRVSPRRVRYAT
jgi:hypothetical protein